MLEARAILPVVTLVLVGCGAAAASTGTSPPGGEGLGAVSETPVTTGEITVEVDARSATFDAEEIVPLSLSEKSVGSIRAAVRWCVEAHLGEERAGAAQWIVGLRFRGGTEAEPDPAIVRHRSSGASSPMPEAFAECVAGRTTLEESGGGEQIELLVVARTSAWTSAHPEAAIVDEPRTFRARCTFVVRGPEGEWLDWSDASLTREMNRIAVACADEIVPLAGGRGVEASFLAEREWTRPEAAGDGLGFAGAPYTPPGAAPFSRSVPEGFLACVDRRVSEREVFDRIGKGAARITLEMPVSTEAFGARHIRGTLGHGR